MHDACQAETEESLARNVNARAQIRGEDETKCVHDRVPAFLPSSVRPAPFKRHVAGEELSANTKWIPLRSASTASSHHARAAPIRRSLKPRLVDPEQVLAAGLKCDRDCDLTPSPVAVIELGKLLGRGAEIGEQSAHGRRALDAYLRAEHSAAVAGHSLQRETVALHELHQNIAGLEKRSGHQNGEGSADSARRTRRRRSGRRSSGTARRG
jgi:hypothetical protein